MNKYIIKRQALLIDESTPNVDARGAFSVAFHNKGTDNATIDDNIELLAGEVWHFNYLPNCEITEPFKVTFSGSASATKKVVAIFSFALLK